MNNENLIPMNKRSKEEHIELSRKGGIASGKAKRRKKSLQQACELMLSAKVKTKAEKDYLKLFGFTNEDFNLQAQLLAAMFQQAINGNVRAAEFIRSVLSEDELIKESEASNDLDTMEEFLQLLRERKVNGLDD